MCHQQLHEGFAKSVHLLRSGLDDHVFFDRLNTGSNEPPRTFHSGLHDADSATPKGGQFFVVAERGYGYPRAMGCLKHGHPFLGGDLFSVYLHPDITHLPFFFLTIVL